MAQLHLPASLIRFITLTVCFALLLSAAAGIPFTVASGRNSVSARQQTNVQNETDRRVTPVPPRTGPPAANLPNLDEVKHRQVQAPRAAAALPSTIRSRRKPLESRNGRRVGDPLPPRVRPTPVATPSGLPTPTVAPTPRSEELTSIRNRPTMLLASILFMREPFGFFPFVTTSPDFSWLPLSDSSAPLFSFDVTAPPVPQAGGAKIVFASSRDGFMQIYVMNSDGTGQMRLTTDGSNNENPRWSPDGTKILFQSDRDNPGSGLRDIYVMNSTGSGQTRLTTDANDDCFASWSADGTKIVIQSLRNGVSYQIYTMNADGSGQVNISNNGVNDIQPSWSPDGTKVAFASERDQTGFPSAYVMNANGTNQTRLTFSGTGFRDEQPVWSPNGSKIAFTSTRDSTTDSWTETDDYEIPEDDGQTFPKSQLNINKEVYVMNTDGSGQTRLTNNLSNDDSPTWSPDGTKIVFRSERERDLFDATPQLWTMNADGSGQTNLSNSGDSDFSPSWTSGSANQPPVAVPGGPYSGVVSQNAPFSGSGSYDPDGTIVSYSWTFGDGGTGSGVAPYHAYATTGTFTVTLSVTDNLGAQATGSTTINISASSSDQYVTSFLQWALGRPPNAEETTYWTDIFRAAYPKGLTAMKLATRELGMTVFESAEYAGRNRNDHWYVYDLYKTFLMREPDLDGWAHWEAAIPIYGRDQIRRGFDESTEFANIVATLTASGSPSANVSSLATARVDPFNQSGNQLQARDAEWSANLLSLPGRAGLDLGLNVSYSSLVFTRSGPYSYFDADNGSPSPGFHIGFPTIQDKYFDAQVGANVYLLKTAAGRRIELRQVGTSNIYESADSSYLQLTAGGSLQLRTTDGTTLNFGWTGINEYRCTWFRDRNGNYILINYDWRGDILNVTDTLGRLITFNYDTNANLSSITQTWNGQTHTWATFGWDNLTMQPSVAGVVGTYSGETMPVLKMVGFHDGTYTKFVYNGNGQVRQITQYASDSNPLTDNHPRNYTVFDYDSATNDCPRLNSTRTWAEYWTGFNGVPSEVTTYFGVDGDARVLTAPDGTLYKETYAGSADAAWMRGLVKSSEVWSAGVQRKLSTVSWTQDNPGVNYKTNPRVTQTIVSDGANVRKTTIDYSIPAYAQFGLPYFVREYAADATTPLRTKYFDYNLAPEYLERRIIGLVDTIHVFDHVSGNYVSKVHLSYDWDNQSNTYLIDQGAATEHDNANYGASFRAGRGNLCAVRRWNVNAINDWNQGQWISFTGYNTHGSVIFTADALGHETRFSYADSFSDGNNSRNTFAYPTTLTDADNFSSTIQYNFDFGAKTRIEGPPPENQPNGIVQTFAYDAAARIDRVTTLNNGAYTRYVYGSYWVQSFSTVNTLADEAYAIQLFDGAGRVFATANNHPGSVGGYRFLNTIYDQMGRAIRLSNPTELNASWMPSGDDAAGVLYTQQTYDWQGRPVRTTHPDGNYKEASYSGCGCAGGEVVTLQGEEVPVNGEWKRRTQKIYSDVLGRAWKTEVLNWNGTVYSTATNTFNARDQVTLVRQWAGPENGGGAYQDTTMSYDGYGRLQSKHVPEQSAGAATTWNYNADDTVQSVTDARGASQTFVYNNRHLVTGITLSAPGGITVPSPVSFNFDAGGNRTSMTDSTGSVAYQFDQLSRMTSETRTFTGLPGHSFTLTYGYNLAGQLTSLSEPSQFGSSVSYVNDSSGKLSSVTGSGFAGGVSQFASNLKYRASGAVKEMDYGNGLRLNNGFNSRLQITNYQVKVPGTPAGEGETARSDYEYFADGRIRLANDITNPGFNRTFSYDLVGRIAGAGTSNSAFSLSIGYDEFDNMIQRNTYSWRAFHSFTSQYQNNRNIQTTTWIPPSVYETHNWTHDAEGNVTHDHNKEYTFNAAGNQTRVFETTQIDATLVKKLWIYQDYDGDGTRVKRVEQQQYNLGAYSFVTSYYLRSSVLDDQIVVELNEYGQKRQAFVYADDEVLAKQKDNQVSWVHVDPMTNSTRETTSTGFFVAHNEFDPLGNNAPLTDPHPPEMTPDYEYVGNYGNNGNPYDGPSGCTLDGQALPCNQVTGFINIGAAGICPNNHCGPRWNGSEFEFLRFTDEGMGYERRHHAQPRNRPTLSRGRQRPRRVSTAKRPRRTAGTPQGEEQKVFGGRATDPVPSTIPVIEHFNSDEARQIRATFEKLFSEPCAAAFRAANLKTPLEVAKAGLVIRPSTDLINYSAAELNLVNDATRLAYRNEFFGGRGTAQAGTIPATRNGVALTTDGSTQIYLDRAWAFNGESLWDRTFSLQDLMSHEFIHAGGQRPKPGRLGSLRHDLAGYDPHDRILAACR